MTDLPELRARLSICEVIGRRQKLRPLEGANFMYGYCPFCDDTIGALVVCEDPGYFHCFGCHAHGDAVGFVMVTEGLAFPEAVEKLARMAGLS